MGEGGRETKTNISMLVVRKEYLETKNCFLLLYFFISADTQNAILLQCGQYSAVPSQQIDIACPKSLTAGKFTVKQTLYTFWKSLRVHISKISETTGKSSLKDLVYVRFFQLFFLRQILFEGSLYATRSVYNNPSSGPQHAQQWKRDFLKLVYSGLYLPLKTKNMQMLALQQHWSVLRQDPPPPPPPPIWVFGHSFTFLHHGTEKVEWHLEWKLHKKIQRKSWSNVPPKLLTCIRFLYKVVHKIGRLWKFNRSREIEFKFLTAWTISMKFGTLVQHAPGYKPLPQHF